jgi:uncharacterized tellurite resistance protein B-like protein
MPDEHPTSTKEEPVVAVLKDRVNAVLYLLDHMVGVDDNLDPNESANFVQSAFQLLDYDIDEVDQRIRWVTRLWREHGRDKLIEEACEILRQSPTLEEDLKILRKMAAADGVIDHTEQQLFDEVCRRVGVSPRTLSLD